MDVSILKSINFPQKYMLDGNVPIVTVGEMSYLVSGMVESGSSDCSILVGRYTSMAHRIVFLLGMNHDHYALTSYPLQIITGERPSPDCVDPPAYPANRHQILIGSDVWIGADAVLMGGVHIGSGAVIGAGAVVAKDVPPYAVVVGNPARIVRYRFDAETVAALLRIKWWNWRQDEISAHIPQFIHDLPAFIAAFDHPIEEDSMDEGAAAIRRLRAEGYHISYFIPDLEMPEEFSIWTHMINDHLSMYSAADKKALVIALSAAAAEHYRPCLIEITRRISARGQDAPLILMQVTEQPFSIPALQASDCYITTRESIAAVAAEFAADAQAAIRYGLDRSTIQFSPRETI